jgi:hypothetical protein
MVALVPKGAAEGARQLEVSDDQVDAWTSRGYVVVGGQAPAKKAPRKAAKKSSK